MPHYLPGENPFLGDYAKKNNLPPQEVRGGADTALPESIKPGFKPLATRSDQARSPKPRAESPKPDLRRQIPPRPGQRLDARWQRRQRGRTDWRRWRAHRGHDDGHAGRQADRRGEEDRRRQANPLDHQHPRPSRSHRRQCEGGGGRRISGRRQLRRAGRSGGGELGADHRARERDEAHDRAGRQRQAGDRADAADRYVLHRGERALLQRRGDPDSVSAGCPHRWRRHRVLPQVRRRGGRRRLQHADVPGD